jgi:hypothetical protein
MSPAERRRERRLDVDISAALLDGYTTVPCRLLNMCSKGFLIELDRAVPLGHAVVLAVPLYASRTIHCTVQIRHVNAQRLGALIIAISSDDQSVCSRFLQETRQARDARLVHA